MADGTVEGHAAGGGYRWWHLVLVAIIMLLLGRASTLWAPMDAAPPATA